MKKHCDGGGQLWSPGRRSSQGIEIDLDPGSFRCLDLVLQRIPGGPDKVGCCLFVESPAMVLCSMMRCFSFLRSLQCRQTPRLVRHDE